MERQTSGEITAALDSSALEVLHAAGRAAAEAGCRAALVGGPVRDLLLGRPPREIDIMIEGDAQRAARALAKTLRARVTAFPRFHTFRLDLPAGGSLDIATARSESYPAPGALPIIEPAVIESDLRRRDFSVNAMALLLNPPERFGELLDPFDGLRDLRAKTLRILHPDSFADDPTRILRGARFAARLGFRFDGPTEKALAEALAADCLRGVSSARLLKEWRLLVSEETPAPALRLLNELGVARCLADGLTLQTALLEPRDRVRDAAAETAAPPETAALARTMAALHGLPETVARAFLRRLAFPKTEREAVLSGVARSGPLHTAARDASTRFGALRLALENLHPAVALFNLATEDDPAARGRLQQCLTATPRPLSISGDDLTAIGCPPGPTFKTLLDELKIQKYEGRLPTREEELTAAREILKSHSSPE